MTTMKQYPEPERREQERWPVLNNYLRVFHKGTKLPLGHIKDIHTQGIRLVSKEAITPNKEMLINIELPPDGGKRERIPLEVRCAWSESNNGRDLYENGFKIISSPEAPQDIEDVVNDVKRLATELSEKAPVRLFDALKHYKDALDKLRTCFSVKTNSGVEKYAYEVLKSRDAVQEVLSDKTPYPGVVLTTIVKLDSDLKKQAKNIARAGDLAGCRESLNPPATAWWWFFDQDSNWFWSFLTILFIYATLAGMVYILPRLFRGGPDIWGALYSIVVVALTLPGVQSALQSLPSSVEQFIIKAGVPAYHLSKVTAISVIIPCIIVYSSIIASPLIADSYRDRGFRRYYIGHLGAALDDYNRALALKPDDAETHFYLGLLYEDLQDLKTARSEYQSAERSCNDKSENVCIWSLNNLARLYIIDKNYDAAISILERQRPVDTAKSNFYLLKNKGWALFEQAHLEEAKGQLVEAVKIADQSTFDSISRADRASAYCLLAQVLDKQEPSDPNACAYWEKCLAYNDRYLPENRAWYYLAQKSLCPS